jgi:hypothetical protein
MTNVGDTSSSNLFSIPLSGWTLYVGDVPGFQLLRSLPVRTKSLALRLLLECQDASMISIRELWDRLHLAQEEHNPDAALCFRHAVEAYNRSDYPSVLFWYQQARMCESVAELSTTN